MSKINYKNIILILIFPFVFVGVVEAQYSRPGSTGADFVRIGVSARAAGMGDAYIAVVNGAEANYYNPAALANMKSNYSVFFNHTSWFAGIKHEFVAASHKFKFGAVGASITALYTGQMKVRTPQQPEGTGATFYAANYRGELSYAKKLTQRVGFGGSVSFLNMRLYNGFVERAYSADIAVDYRTHFRNFRFAMMIANLGSSIKFVNESYPQPVNFSFGASIDVIDGTNNKVLVSAEAKKPNDGDPLGQAGLEYSFKDLFFVRGGYKFNYDSATYSAGAGVRITLSGYKLRFDYSYSQFKLLGVANRFSMQLNF